MSDKDEDLIKTDVSTEGQEILPANGGQKQEAPPPPPPTFRRDAVPNSVVIGLELPKLFPGVKFVFRLRLALSKELKDKQEKLVGQPQSVITAAQKTATLDEVCDLLQAKPEGLGDWPDDDMRAPGLVFYDYVTQTPEGSNARTILGRLVRGVSNGFWGAVAPQEFPA